MLYLIGLGLNEKGYSKSAYEAISKADKVYVENYTVEFPYDLKKLESQFEKKKFIRADRDLVESSKLVDEATEKNIALLVYGSPLMATTHISLVQEAKKKDVEVKVLHSSSVLDAVAETGLQLYKFGKIASMPKFEANSYAKIIDENEEIGAHSLILIDIGMKFEDALGKLIEDTKKKMDFDKMVVCTRLGTDSRKIVYGKINDLKSLDISAPFCFIVPGKLHFLEKEVLESFKIK